MRTVGLTGDYNLDHHGLQNLRTAYWNLTPSALIEQVIILNEATLSNTGAIVVDTGKHTGRSPNDKFIVNRKSYSDDIWWGKSNQPLAPEKFSLLFHKLGAFLQGKDVFIQDLLAGADPAFQVPIRLITDKAWSALFAYNLFIRLPAERIAHHHPQFTILHCPDFQATPQEDGTNSPTCVAIDFTQKMILITGTSYAGEIKKSVFTALNFLLPAQNVLPMHCSANLGKVGDVALFFGLSGTGKTTLSSDPERRLIGDDEHGWSEHGVFNFEGGCYAKTIHLRPDLEPLIWSAAHCYGAVLENVTSDPYTRELDFDDDHRTENTRGAYPIHFVPNHVPEGFAGTPKNVFFLTADAFGILPPISRLDIDQAMYYFLSGYTSKLAGTETGLGAEPQTTFSACFGAPFLPLHPKVYADLLGKKITENDTRIWLVNTGWTGGRYGVGHRIKLAYTRAMIREALNGGLDQNGYRKEPFFGLLIPQKCAAVPAEVLDPQFTWLDKTAYVSQATQLMAQFEKNFEQFNEDVTESVRHSGPHMHLENKTHR